MSLFFHICFGLITKHVSKRHVKNVASSSNVVTKLNKLGHESIPNPSIFLKKLICVGRNSVHRISQGNKSDLAHIREVYVEDGKKLAELEGLFFIETSALDTTNILRAFQIVVKEIYINVSKKILNSDSDMSQLSLNRVNITDLYVLFEKMVPAILHSPRTKPQPNSQISPKYIKSHSSR